MCPNQQLFVSDILPGALPQRPFRGHVPSLPGHEYACVSFNAIQSQLNRMLLVRALLGAKLGWWL